MDPPTVPPRQYPYPPPCGGEMFSKGDEVTFELVDSGQQMAYNIKSRS